MATVTEILQREASNTSDTKYKDSDQPSVKNAAQNPPMDSKKGFPESSSQEPIQNIRPPLEYDSAGAFFRSVGRFVGFFLDQIDG
jgi:hypothetical protein